MSITGKPIHLQLPVSEPRLRLARDIAAGHVKCWHFIRPEFRRTYDDGVIAYYRIQEFEHFGCADRGEPESGLQTSIVRLTPAGEEWLNRYGSNE